MLNGVSIGLMYSLIALGFVLVYKATDAINFAQGEFVMMAGLIAAAVLALDGAGRAGIAAVVATLAVMIGFGFGLERVVLRPLLGRPVVAVIMATIGLAAVLRGLTPIIFGGETRALPLPIGDEPIVIGPATLPPIQVLGAAVAILLLRWPSPGSSRRAAWAWRCAPSPTTSRWRRPWASTSSATSRSPGRWPASSSALGGIVWGSMLGVDVQLALVGLKVFPVVILGGLDSIGGALVGGLIVGIVENLAAGYLDPYVGGGTKDFAPYVLMILVLMIRPYGIFGKRQIERV